MSENTRCTGIHGIYGNYGTYAIGGAPLGDYFPTNYPWIEQKRRCHKDDGHGQCPHEAASGSWTCYCHGG
jgi:hypothetical protein